MIAAILIIWGVVQAPNKKELEERRRVQDSLFQLQQKSVQQADSIITVTPEAVAPKR